MSKFSNADGSKDRHIKLKIKPGDRVCELNKNTALTI